MIVSHSSPIPLELTAVHEGVVMDNLQMFEMNGFLFEIDHNGVLQPCMYYNDHPKCVSNLLFLLV